MKIAKKNTEPIIAKTTWDRTVIIENLKEHKTLLKHCTQWQLVVSSPHVSCRWLSRSATYSPLGRFCRTFPWLPVTSNDLDRRNGRNFALFYCIGQVWPGQLCKSGWKVTHTEMWRKSTPKNPVFTSTWLMAIFTDISENEFVRERGNTCQKAIIW